VIVVDWPRSITTDVGEIVTARDASTVTAAFVAGVAAPPVGPPTVPESVRVTVNTHVVVVPVGVYVTAVVPEFAKPGQLPDLIDQA